MSIFHFVIHPDVSIETAWQELEIAGIEVLYSDEDSDGQNKIIVCLLSPSCAYNEWLGKLPSVLAIKPAADLQIDWEAQWSEHGLNFREGFVHIRVGGLEFILKPGPGFGDASHPSTRLVLQMMEGVVPNHSVLDIGCGSGILSLAAAHLGATPIYAIDIDPDAIRHTIENISLNTINKPIWIGSAQELIDKKPNKPLIALMNMISSEQELAWSSLEPLHPLIHTCITSGVLVDQKSDYVNLWKTRGWKIHDTLQEGEWLAFVMQREPVLLKP